LELGTCPEAADFAALELNVALMSALPIVPGVKWERKFLWLLMAASLALVGAGCSGINASYGVSPASFFLPGFGQAEPVQVPNHNTSSNYLTSVESVEMAAKGI
jgi:hypothetical protein